MSGAAVSRASAPLVPTRIGPASAAGGAAAALCLAVLGASPIAVVLAAVVFELVWLAVLDLEYRLVPNRLVLPTTAAVLAMTSILEPADALERVAASVGAAAFLLIAALARPGGLGMGDVKLAALIGAACGAAVTTAILVGFGAAGVAGLLLLLRHGRVALKQQLPLAPFLALGAIVALLAGHG